MSEIVLLYLFTRVDVLQHAAVVVTAFSLVVFGIATLAWYSEDMTRDLGKEAGNPYRRKADEMLRLRHTLRNVLIVSAVLAVFTPSQRDLAVIVGGKLLIDVAQSKEASETTQKAYKLLQQKLDEALEQKNGK